MSDTLLKFHPLTFVADRDGVMVGRPDSGSYALLPDDGANLLRQLADGLPVGDAADWYRDTFREPVDMDEFITELRDLGFILTQEELEQPVPPASALRQRLARAMFSPPAWILYIAVVIGANIALTRYPVLQPAPANIYFTSSLLLAQVTLVLTQFLTTAWHEWFHVLAARRAGVPSRLGVSRRLIFLVVETQMPALLSLPRRRRYLPILAGLVGDVLLFSVLSLVAAIWVGSGPLPWPGRLAIAIAYSVQLRVVWQFFLFLRTDPYYALATALGTVDLAGASRAWLRNLLWLRGRRARRALYRAQWSSRDRRHAPWFAIISLVGFCAMFTLMASRVLFPLVSNFVSRIAAGINQGTLGPRFWDSVLSLAFFAFVFVIFPIAGARLERRSMRRQVPSDADR